jgi:hypothetical protein
VKTRLLCSKEAQLELVLKPKTERLFVLPLNESLKDKSNFHLSLVNIHILLKPTLSNWLRSNLVKVLEQFESLTHRFSLPNRQNSQESFA